MRYLSLLFLVFLVGWSYALSHRPRDISVEVHGFLVQELKSVMTDFLKEKVQGVQNIQFYQVYTEVVKPGEQLLAYVKYSYESPTTDGELTREVREGEFDLVSKDRGATWEPKARNFRDLNLEFLEEMKIVPGSSGDEAETDESSVEI